MADNRTFSYQACDAQGKVHSGSLVAETEQEVVSVLQSRHLIPIRIETAQAREEARLFQRRGIRPQELINFTNGLCTLVESHVPLDKALTLLEGLAEKPAGRELIGHLRREVKEGKSLADAMQTRPLIFSRMYINIVRAGEEGGILDKLLPRLAQFLQDASEARSTVQSALLYPAFLLIVGIVSVVLLLGFVVPKFAVLFADMGPAMPDSARLLLAFSDWVKNWGWTLLLPPPLLWYLWHQAGATPPGRLQRDAWLLRLPILGGLLRKVEASRFCRTLGALIGSGIPLLKSLHIARGVMENRLLEHSIGQVEEAVRRGTSLGRALANAGQFPVLLSQMVVVGEETGRTAPILHKLAETYDSEIRRDTARLVGMVEPALIVTLGVLIGAIVMIMMSAIFSINEVQF